MSRLCIVACCLITALAGFASMARAVEEPPAPENFISDGARLFEPPALQRLASQLASAQRAYDVSIYVASFSYLDGDSMRDRSLALVKNWLGDRAGIVFAYNRGNSLPAISASPELWRRYPADEVASLLNTAGRVLAKADVPPDQRVSGAVGAALDQLRAMDKPRQARMKSFGRTELNLAAGFLGVLAVIGVVLGIIARRQGRATNDKGEKFFFPDVTVVTRLSAPFGGGIIGQSRRDV